MGDLSTYMSKDGKATITIETKWAGTRWEANLVVDGVVRARRTGFNPNFSREMWGGGTPVISFHVSFEKYEAFVGPYTYDRKASNIHTVQWTKEPDPPRG